jgi:hypothetical protein
MKDGNNFLIFLAVSFFVIWIIEMGMIEFTHIKVDCIKNTSKECYSADQIYKLCGV